MNNKSYFNSIRVWFNRLSHREKLIITITSFTAILLAIFSLFELANAISAGRDKELRRLESNYIRVQELAREYNQVSATSKRLSQRFTDSSLSFEALTKHIKSIISSVKPGVEYDLTKSGNSVELSDAMKGTTYQLQIGSLDPQSLLKLLQGLENGSPPLFLNEVTISKDASKELSALIQIVLFDSNTGA